MNGLLGRDKAEGVEEFFTKFLLQLFGAFVGSILFVLLIDGPSGPVPNGAYMQGKTDLGTPNGEWNDARLFIMFMIANMAQAYLVGQFDHRNMAFANSYMVSACYMMSWLFCQFSFVGALGGVTVDLGRMFASELTHGDAFENGKFWIVLAAPFAGWLLGFGTILNEEKMKAMEAAKGGNSAQDTIDNAT